MAKEGRAGDEATHQPPFDFAAYKESAMAKVPADQKELIKNLEEKEGKATDKAEKKKLLNELIAASEKNKLDAIACNYSREIAKTENTVAAWVKTGDNFSETYGGETTNAGLRAYLIQGAQESYQKALDLQPENTDVKIGLATTFIDGQQQPMAGVTMLLDIVRKDSNNVKAQLILGRYGIVSGQYDKAIQRLTRVTVLEPKNTEAWFSLAQAYQGKGDNAKALEYFEKCKTLVNDPQFNAEIDSYINQIKKQKN